MEVASSVPLYSSHPPSQTDTQTYLKNRHKGCSPGLPNTGYLLQIIPVGFRLIPRLLFRHFLRDSHGNLLNSPDKRHLSWQSKVAAMSWNEIRIVEMLLRDSVEWWQWLERAKHFTALLTTRLQHFNWFSQWPHCQGMSIIIHLLQCATSNHSRMSKVM